MPSNPSFSVVIPTRDRPSFVRWCVEALTAQTFGDFEVVVSDNSITASCRAEVERFGDDRVRYLAPETPLSMADNWRFATAAARGDYVSVITDKTILVPSALQHAAAVVDERSPDIVTWWSDGYDLLDEKAGIAAGFYRPYFRELRPTEYAPRDVLRERLEFAERRGSEGVRYYWGKLPFGVFSRALLERIEQEAGHVFFPIAPDYTSMVPAMWLARDAVDLGRPLAVAFNSMVSNGQRVATEPEHARRFLHETDPTGAILEALPIPGLYTSVHNIVAHDYDTSLRRVAGADALHVDRGNLAVRAAEDLEDVQWDSREEEQSQHKILDEWCRDERVIVSGQRDKTRRMARRHRARGTAKTLVARAPRVLRRLARRSPSAVRCSSILEATHRAEARYTALD